MVKRINEYWSDLRYFSGVICGKISSTLIAQTQKYYVSQKTNIEQNKQHIASTYSKLMMLVIILI